MVKIGHTHLLQLQWMMTPFPLPPLRVGADMPLLCIAVVIRRAVAVSYRQETEADFIITFLNTPAKWLVLIFFYSQLIT